MVSANKQIIPLVVLNHTFELTIYGENAGDTIFQVIDAHENGEAIFQIKEGNFYEYEISNNKFCLEASEIVSQSKVNASSGRISPNIYVGTLTLNILDRETEEKCSEVKLEVQSVKTSYREDYRHMLEEITEKCTELLLQHSSPVSQFFEADFNGDANTLYQRFAFIKSILDTIEFNDSIHKILTSPVTKWKESETIKDIRSIRRIKNSGLRQIGFAKNRVDLPNDHPLKSIVSSLPSKLRSSYNIETVDTQENRFIKHALTSFQSLCWAIKSKIKGESRLKHEVEILEDKLEQYISHSIFKEISALTALPLNSPVLQRKEGYREILRVWLMFDLAAKLVWHGGNDVYSGDKKDVAVLYEYWLFFKLLDILKDVFKIEPEDLNDLIKTTNDGLGLQLKQGQYLPLKGVYDGGTRKLAVEFSYNRTFSGSSSYPDGGSWTKSMRPDYTLSIWPYGIDNKTAEKEELIVHVHFDAKYKIEKLNQILGDDKDLLDEKVEQQKGTFKRIDLLKMHSYKDAIRRTAGAYILYPGDELPYNKLGFHELIPGLGAFSIRPSKINDGTQELKKFLNEIIAHFLNRTSQREKMSFKTFESHQDYNSNELNEALPETYGLNRNLLPDETFVMIGFYDSEEKLNWILNNKLYNFRTGTDRGSLPLGLKESSAKYLLLHSHGDNSSASKLYKIKNKGPRIFSKSDLLKKRYPNPSGDIYLVYELAEDLEKEFNNQKWNISELEGYKSGRGSSIPFAVSLTELMKVVIR